MVRDPVERVAEAFDAADCSGRPHEEPEAPTAPFRDLASAAIAILSRQMADVRSVTVLRRPLRREASTQGARQKPEYRDGYESRDDRYD
jgi:hypothetical protein